MYPLKKFEIDEVYIINFGNGMLSVHSFLIVLVPYYTVVSVQDIGLNINSATEINSWLEEIANIK